MYIHFGFLIKVFFGFASAPVSLHVSRLIQCFLSAASLVTECECSGEMASLKYKSGQSHLQNTNDFFYIRGREGVVGFMLHCQVV